MVSLAGENQVRISPPACISLNIDFSLTTSTPALLFFKAKRGWTGVYRCIKHQNSRFDAQYVVIAVIQILIT
jgi:hypothetical protein